MTITVQPGRSTKQLRSVPLLAFGVSVSLGLIILGNLLGVLQHVEIASTFSENAAHYFVRFEHMLPQNEVMVGAQT